MINRRRAVNDVKHVTSHHPGLWLDKFIAYEVRERGDPKYLGAELVDQVSKSVESQDYRSYHDQWKHDLCTVEGHFTRHLVPKDSSRLIVGLGAESVLENAIAIHRTHGVPFIPGSALKGLASSFAHRKLENSEWRKGSGKAHIVIFGDTDNAGFVTFFDAMPTPASWALHPQVMTVHHPLYYQDGSQPPADWDSPIPIPFVSATGEFLLALAGPEEWVNLAVSILERALSQEGIGAKTSSGFGRLKFKVETETYERQQPIVVPT